MHFLRLAESTELNNAWIVGAGAVGALAVLWLAVVLSIFLVRQAGHALQIPALRSLADGYARRARLVAVVASFAVAVAGAAALAYALWRHIDLQRTVDQALAEVTEDALLAVARSAGVVVLFLLAFYLLQVGGRRVLARVQRRVSPHDLAERQRMFLDRTFLHLPSVINLALAYALLGLAAETFRLPGPVEWFLLTVVYVLLLVSGGRALVMLAHFISERMLSRWEVRNKDSKLEEYYAALRRLLPVIQRSIEAIVYVSVATLIVHRFEALAPFAPYGPLLIRVISMFLVASVLIEVARVLIARVLLATPGASDDTHRRRITFVALLQSIVKYMIYFCVSLMVLKDLGVDPTPILAGAGILGLTLGLGAQKIVQDVLNGLLLLFEDQILQGDYIKIHETEGVVEQMSLRITRIRDRLGRLHIMRNGEVQNVINYSRGWTMAVVEMGVSYEDDLGKALRVISEVCARLPAMIPDQVIEAPQVRGIETIGVASLAVRIETKVAPGTHYDVKRALHRMLIDAFVANRLEIPYPKSIGVPFARKESTEQS
jgi:moderate conductance mechanosensitive channel